ncbi:hypothetical protein ACIBCH_03655 [Amycolatopsis thailandensis]|uniref:hypothetical protein n=1 Tax=Amycolatopsis thailandensis TaxID=589330 RepID=UPI0037A575C8
MPVSRGRKPKKNKKPQLAGGPVSFPSWFDEAIENIINGMDGLLVCETARDLEQATCELLGAELKHVLDEEYDGLDFDLFFAALVGEVHVLSKAEPSEALWRFLHGLLAISAPGVVPGLRSSITRVNAGSTAGSLSEWPRSLKNIEATGDIWEMRDVYGTRLAVIAAYSYPGVYLFDVDMSGLSALTDGGVYDDVEQAAAAWRKKHGGDAEPREVTDTGRLAGLAGCDFLVIGDESRDALDNWYRAQRRLEDLDATLRKRKTPLPPHRSFFDDADPAEMARPFAAWHIERYGNEPDPMVVEDLAEEWMGGLVPDTRFSASPDRIRYYQEVIGDWRDHPHRPAAQALLPKWVRWLGERAGLPSPLVEGMVAQATK